MYKHTLVLFNPHANEEFAKRLWPKIASQYPMLPKEPTDITIIDDVGKLITEKKPDLIIIAGGDGTINVVCKAVEKLTKKPDLAVLPFGFGNALAYCLGVETIEKAMQVIQSGSTKVTIDAMRTNIPQATLGLFNIGIGFDARIVHNRTNDRYIGYRSYIISAIKSLVFHQKKDITIIIDKTVTIHALTSSLVVAKCPIIGRNYLVSPQAKLTDGLLDCTLFSTHFAYLTNLRLRGFKHPLYSKEQKIFFKATHIRIEGEPVVQIDGDPYIHKGSVEIEIIPAVFTFLRNTKTNLDDFDFS